MIFILFLTVGAVVWLKLNQAHLYGRMGEIFVSRKLRKIDPKKYLVLDDILIPSKGNINTTQIDHVVISNFGIFCVETKAHSGWIFGDANQKYWTSQIYRSRNMFYNPVWQNHAHVSAVADLLKEKFSNLPVMSYVIFTNADRIKISGNAAVGRVRDFVVFAKSFHGEIISDEKVMEVYSLLKNSNIVDKKLRREHVRKVKGLRSL